MDNSVSRALIETIVRRTLREIKDSPERSSRNLIDMALTFADGRFQQAFLQIAQELLSDENSAYYDLIRDTVANVDANRLVGFGMNIGYNSCTYGARIIRANESSLGFDIPWSLLMEINAATFAENEAAYRSLIGQGIALGIYTWMIFAGSAPECVLSLAAEQKECAFVLFCEPEAVTEAFLDEAEPFTNLMVVVRCGEGAAEACARLRRRRFLFSLYIPYGDGEEDGIVDGDWMYGISSLHPVFTAFVPRRACSQETQLRVCEFVRCARLSKDCLTVVWELICDGLTVDRIISSDACSAGVDVQGGFHALSVDGRRAMGNLLSESLEDVLRRAFPKSAANEKDHPV